MDVQKLYSEDDLISFLNTHTYLMDGGLSSV